MTNLLKLSVLATMSALFAYGHTNDDGMESGSGFELGVELQGAVNQISWAFEGNDTTAAAGADVANKGVVYQYDILTNFEHRYSDKADDILASFAGKIVGSYSINDDFSIAVYAGAEGGMKDGQSVPVLGMTNATNNGVFFTNNAAAGAADTFEDLTAANHGNKTLKAKYVPFVGARVLYGSVGLAAQYEMKKFESSGYHAGVSTDLNKEHKDNMVLVGFYGKTDLDLSGDMNFSLFVEGMSNFRQKSDDEMKTFWTNVAIKSEGNDDATTLRVSVNDLVSSYNKVSVGLGVNFANF